MAMWVPSAHWYMRSERLRTIRETRPTGNPYRVGLHPIESCSDRRGVERATVVGEADMRTEAFGALRHEVGAPASLIASRTAFRRRSSPDPFPAESARVFAPAGRDSDSADRPDGGPHSADLLPLSA